MSGTIEGRQAVFGSLDPEKRKQVFTAVPQQVLACTPDPQKEAEAARQAQQEERQKEFGRTEHENSNAGTDHGRGDVMMVLGGSN